MVTVSVSGRRGAAIAGLIGAFTVTIAGNSLAVHLQNKSVVPTFALPAKMPEGATPLITGATGQMADKWVVRGSRNPATWPVSADGVASTNGVDITSKQEFGDCFVHVEFRAIPGEDGKMHNGGNSGIGIQGRYEIQMFDSYGKPPDASGIGAFYSQKAPIVNSSRPGGQWQTYDIIFRSPRLDNASAVVEKPRATVFLNGVIVQNNEEFNGPTGIQYGEFKGMPKTGPIVLQGNHDPQQFRNLWVVTL